MKARKFEQKFDEGVDLTASLVLSKAKRVLQEQRRVNVDFLTLMIDSLDHEASKLGVTRQSAIKVCWLSVLRRIFAQHKIKRITILKIANYAVQTRARGQFYPRARQISALHPHHRLALLQPALIALAVRVFNAVTLDLEGGVDKAVFGRPGAGGTLGTRKWYYRAMKRRHQRIVELIFSRPTSGNVQWRDVEGLFVELGAEIEERAGSRVSVKARWHLSANGWNNTESNHERNDC